MAALALWVPAPPLRAQAVTNGKTPAPAAVAAWSVHALSAPGQPTVRLLVRPNALTPSTNFLLLAPSAGTGNLGGTNRPPATLRFSYHLQAPPVATNAEALPLPGVYQTEPYACIVVVPGGHPDDRSVIKPAGPTDAMPALQPELRFVPRSSK